MPPIESLLGRSWADLARSRDAGTVPVLGATAPWDLYALDGFTMHLEYSPTSGLVQLVSLATPA